MKDLLTSTLLVAALQSAWAQAALPDAAYVDQRAYSVYAAALKLDANTSAPLLIRQQTGRSDNCIRPNGPHAEEVRDAAADLNRLAATPLQLVSEYLPAGAARLVSPDEAKAAEASIIQGNLDPALSHGLTSLSPVGFSKNGLVAAVFVGHWCGLSCGTWQSHIFINAADHWAELPNQIGCLSVS